MDESRTPSTDATAPAADPTVAIVTAKGKGKDKTATAPASDPTVAIVTAKGKGKDKTATAPAADSTVTVATVKGKGKAKASDPESKTRRFVMDTVEALKTAKENAAKLVAEEVHTSLQTIMSMIIQITGCNKYDAKILDGSFELSPKDPIHDIKKICDKITASNDPIQFIKTYFVNCGIRLCAATFPRFFPTITSRVFFDFMVRKVDDTDKIMYIVTAKQNLEIERDRKVNEIVDPERVIVLTIKHEICSDTIEDLVIQYALYNLIMSSERSVFVEMQPDTHLVVKLEWDAPIEKYLKQRSTAIIGTVHSESDKPVSETLKGIEIKTPFVAESEIHCRTETDDSCCDESEKPHHKKLFTHLLKIGHKDTGCGINCVPYVRRNAKTGKFEHVNVKNFTKKQHTLLKTKLLNSFRATIPRNWSKTEEDAGQCDVFKFIGILENFLDFQRGQKLSSYTLHSMADQVRALLQMTNQYDKVIEFFSKLPGFKKIPGFTDEEIYLIQFMLEWAGGLGNAGNHYFEIVISPEGYLYLSVHSGGRGIGSMLYELIEELNSICSQFEYSEGPLAEFTAMVSELVVMFAKYNRLIVIGNALEYLHGEPVDFTEIFNNASFESGMQPIHLANMMFGMTHNATTYYADSEGHICKINQKGSTIQLPKDEVALIAGGCPACSLGVAFNKDKRANKWFRISAEDYVKRLPTHEQVDHTKTEMITGPHGTGRSKPASHTFKDNFEKTEDPINAMARRLRGNVCNLGVGIFTDQDGYKSAEIVEEHMKKYNMQCYIAMKLYVGFKEATSEYNMHKRNNFDYKTRTVLKTNYTEVFEKFVQTADEHWLPLVTEFNSMTVEQLDQYLDSEIINNGLGFTPTEAIEFVYMLDVMQCASMMTAPETNKKYLEPLAVLHKKLDILRNAQIP